MLINTKFRKAILLSLIAFLSFLGCNKMENDTLSSLMMPNSPSESLDNSDIAAKSGVTTSTTGFPIIDLFDWVSPRALCGFGVNNMGKVVGVAGTESGQHAFLWSRQYGVKDLGTLCDPEWLMTYGGFSMANDINDLGQIVGLGWFNYTQEPEPHPMRAFFWSDKSGMVNLGPSVVPPEEWGDPYSNGFGLNNHGEVVGNVSGHAFLWTKELGMVLLSSQQYDGAAWDINDNGWIVGIRRIDVDLPSEQHHAVLWTDVGEMLDLGTLNGYSNSQALGINYRGEVVGGNSNFLTTVHERIGSELWNIVLDPPCVPFIWTKKKGMSQLPMLDGNAGCAHAINDRGQIVGWSYTGSEVHAVVWISKDSIMDLGKLLPEDVESVAYGINNLGQVVGYCMKEDGTRHAVIWTVK